MHQHNWDIIGFNGFIEFQRIYWNQITNQNKKEIDFVILHIENFSSSSKDPLRIISAIKVIN